MCIQRLTKTIKHKDYEVQELKENAKWGVEKETYSLCLGRMPLAEVPLAWSASSRRAVCLACWQQLIGLRTLPLRTGLCIRQTPPPMLLAAADYACRVACRSCAAGHRSAARQCVLASAHQVPRTHRNLEFPEINNNKARREEEEHTPSFDPKILPQNSTNRNETLAVDSQQLILTDPKRISRKDQVNLRNENHKKILRKSTRKKNARDLSHKHTI